MGDELLCFLCGKNSGQVSLFSPETLKKCQTVLNQRKIHNLKYKDIILPSEYTDIGFHRECYKSFTALMKKFFTLEPKSLTGIGEIEKANEISIPTENLSLASIQNKLTVESSPTESSAVIKKPLPKLMSSQPSTSQEVSDSAKKACLFCEKSKKKLKTKILPVCETDKEQFKLVTLPDIENREVFYDLSTRLKQLTGNKVFYHVDCRVKFNNQINTSNKIPILSEWHTYREYHQRAFKEICLTIEYDIIKNGRCHMLFYLHEVYIDLLRKIFEENGVVMDITFTPQHLEEKLIKVYSEQVNFFTYRKKNILAPNHINEIDEATFEKLQSENILQKAALILRKIVLEVSKKKIPTRNISAEHLIEGEVSIPQQLFDFYSTLVGGCSRRRKRSIKCIRKIRSYCQDIIYGIHSGKLKTSKHIMLGMTLKSLTSSRKVIDIINRYGHCISYQGVEELETESTYTSINKSNLCPEKIKKTPELFTGVVFDNFDRYVETASGKDTLHDTVGIIYQNIEINSSGPEVPSEVPSSESSSPNQSKRKRRTFDIISTEETPYPKKPKMTSDLQSTADEIENLHPSNTQLYSDIDNIWMISHAAEICNTPMWVGFNSIVFDCDAMGQQISYLTPINESPTSNSVVLETMNQSKKIADELSQSSMQVTYDLAIAKIALQIQATEKPEFDRLFIHLGPFHIMMAFFKAVGKVISDCGLMNVMVESNLIANGSVNGFLDGKHFNRCKRLHPLMALGLEILHFKSFLQFKNKCITDEIIGELTRLQNCTVTSFIIENEGLKDLLNEYSIYKQKSIKGEFGKTQQFYLIYINLIHHYLDLSRSIRAGDFELFKSVLPKITNLFFVCNHQNYARWTVKYVDNLIKVAETHPDLYEGFKKGYFGIKRTTKSFSRQPIDLVLEQTINADAARRLTGVVHFTNSISARQRWARSHDARSTIINQVYQELGLQTHQDISSDLNQYNIKKNNKQLKTFIRTFDQFINPFSLEIPQDKLVNISSGKAASELVESFLLNIEKNGECQRSTFIAECLNDISRFEKSIKKTPLNNFSKDLVKRKIIRIGSAVQEVRIPRDLFGRLLGISMDYNVDISKILSHPITTVPLSICHLDGTVCKTDKSTLMKCLEKEAVHQPPPYIDVIIIDGFFLLHTMKNVPNKFGSISRKMLQMVTQFQASRVDVIFDQYFSPSIKDYEHSQRFESAQLSYTITGPDQVRPSDFGRELKNSNFKEALVNFFILHWATDEMVPFICTKTIHINFRQCHSFIVNTSNSITSEVVDDLSCSDHEEADTKIIYHACSINYQANIVIRSTDTDIAAIMLGNMHHLKNENSLVWMMTGTGNHLRYIDLTKIHTNLGESICKSLPAFHAITGCDYNPAFFRKGKSRPYKILKDSEEFQKTFIQFGGNHLFENIDERKDAFDIIQKMICQIYNVCTAVDVDAARLQLFMNTYRVTNIDEMFNRKRLRSFDASSLPPCKAELLQQFLRANYIASIWNNAHQKIPSTYKPDNNGWLLEHNQFHFKWFEGDQLPNFVRDSLKTPSETTNESDIEIENEAE